MTKSRSRISCYALKLLLLNPLFPNPFQIVVCPNNKSKRDWPEVRKICLITYLTPLQVPSDGSKFMGRNVLKHTQHSSIKTPLPTSGLRCKRRHQRRSMNANDGGGPSRHYDLLLGNVRTASVYRNLFDWDVCECVTICVWHTNAFTHLPYPPTNTFF